MRATFFLAAMTLANAQAGPMTTGGTTVTRAGKNAGVLKTLALYHQAMVDADTAVLDRLLDNTYSLTHITGLEQPRAEWFNVMRSGAFDYHRITLDDTFTNVQVRGDAATASGRGVFNATINGVNNPWRLAFTMQFRRQSGKWLVQRARYTTF